MDHDAPPPQATLDPLRDALRAFTAARDWGQFHSPKNLAMALSVEAAELLEVFQWMPDADSRHPEPAARAAAAEEIADVLLYLILIGDALGIDPVAAAERKIAANAEKYPVDKARGTSRKYTEL
ncbi:MAG: nucleotide pyrophosphohydrolase [Burkholderiales bacterium]